MESAYTRRFNKHSEEESVSQDRKVQGVVALAIDKELAVHPALVEIVDDKVVAVLDCADHLGGPEPRLLYKYRKKNIILV